MEGPSGETKGCLQVTFLSGAGSLGLLGAGRGAGCPGVLRVPILGLACPRSRAAQPAGGSSIGRRSRQGWEAGHRLTGCGWVLLGSFPSPGVQGEVAAGAHGPQCDLILPRWYTLASGSFM